MKLQRIKNIRGFTLIELLVVVAIIGVLSSVVLSSLNTARVKSRDAQRISHIREIQKALELYYDDYGYYPKKDGGTGISSDYAFSDWGNSCGGWWCTLETLLNPYIKTLPRDPRGYVQLSNWFYYRTHGDGQSYGLGSILENAQSISINDGGCENQSFEIGPSLARCGCVAAHWRNQGTTICP